MPKPRILTSAAGTARRFPGAIEVNPNATSRAPLVPALCWFAAANMLLLLFVFRGALWGGALLAPLDIPPALFTQYQYVQPAQPPVPANHHIIDAIYYDLPLQKTIYESYRRGEAPWWDPYSFAGRPLLADAHINGTDWVRVLCYRLLPFEAAYNWTRILHFLISGLGMLLLLRAFGFEAFVSVMLALTYEFAGGFACFFCHPWVQASFLFYPFLWLLWDAAWRTSLGWREGVAGVLAAGVFYSGNIQSHAYLPVFALAFCGGYAGRSRAGWGRALRIVAVSGLLGALLAAPVLLNEIEFYALGLHMTAPSPPLGLLAGAASLSGLYPWLLGTFRTLDVGRVLGFSGLGFCVYIGSAAFVLALLALRAPLAAAFVARRRMAAWLVFFYFGLILSTPLRVALYTRSCGLALIA